MKRIKGFFSLVVAGTLFLGLGAGFAASKNVSAKEKANLSKVTLKVGETGWSNYEKGFKAAGLDKTPYKVQYYVFQGGNLCLEAMAAKQLDLTWTSEIPPIFASKSENGGNFKVIAVQQANTLQQELVVAKGSDIKKVSDLKGRKVAYVQNTTAQYFLLKMLKKAGLKWNDINAVALTTSDGLAALTGGKVDALASYGNSIISAHQQGATLLASGEKILSGNFPVEASLEAIKNPGKHAAIVDYISRINKFYIWARKNKQKWAEIIAENTHQQVSQALETFSKGEAKTQTKIVPTSKKAIDSEQDIADVFKEVGLVNGNTKVDSFWNNSFDVEISKLLK